MLFRCSHVFPEVSLDWSVIAIIVIIRIADCLFELFKPAKEKAASNAACDCTTQPWQVISRILACASIGQQQTYWLPYRLGTHE